MANSLAAGAGNGPAKTASGLSHEPSESPNQLAKAAIKTDSRGGLVLDNIEAMSRFGECVVRSGMAPKGYTRPEQVIVALQWGRELGLGYMQSLANIAVINGRPSLWGDALVALVRRSPLCKSISKPKYEGGGESRVCTIKAERINGDEAEGRFGYADAKRAKLLAKDAYQLYPDRMYYHRAVGYVVHELFPDLLMGLGIVEEVQDVEFAKLEPRLTSGDEAPLDSLDDAAELLASDDLNISGQFQSVSGPTPEELADPNYEVQTCPH